jgi:hypothetical protein
VDGAKGNKRKFVLVKGESRPLSKEKPDPTEFVTILPLQVIDDASIKWCKRKRN